MKKTLRNPSGFPVIVTKAIRSSLKVITFSSLLLPAASYGQTDTLLALRDSSHITRLALLNNGGLNVWGTFDSLAPAPYFVLPVEDPGNRMMWYPSKSSFRAGRESGSSWDDVNIGYYSFATGEGVRASADHTVAMGARCHAIQTSAFAAGEQNVASGAASVAMGYHAHTNARQGSFVFGDRSTIDTIRAGVNHSANWRVSGGFRIFTSSNLTTGMTFQSGASISNWGQSSAVISTSTGALLTTGGVWTNASDVNRKHLFENISGEDILLKLRKLPVTRWSYKSESNNVRHIGPMAQDFYAAFGLGNDNRSIGTVDADGIALAAIKALEARTSQLSDKLETLQAENETLRHQLTKAEKPSVASQAGFPAIILLGAAGLIGLLVRRRRTMEAKS